MTSLPPIPPGGVVVGVGIDVVAIDRFAQALLRSRGLADRLFAPDEQLTPGGVRRSAASLAARFAVKEAVAKALGVPRGMDWHDCRVVTAASGRPVLQVSGTVAAAALAAGVSDWRLSLSHDAGIAAAVVIALGSTAPGSTAIGSTAIGSTTIGSAPDDGVGSRRNDDRVGRR